MYWRIAELLWFDLSTSLLRLKGLIFLIPFALFWFVTLRLLHGGVAEFLQQQEGLALASLFFDVEQVRSLFIENPPVLSLCLVIGLTSLPLFAMLAGMDQFAGDLGRGYFQLLATRCRRGEIFLARYLSALLIMAAAIVLLITAATGLALFNSGYPPATTVIYGLQSGMLMILYGAALLAFVALISVITRSAIGALFLSLLIYVVLLVTAAALNALLPGLPVFDYLLPSGLKESLFHPSRHALLLATASLPAYTLAYGWLAWRVFRSSRL